MSKEAMKLALEALENWLEFDPENFGEVDKKAITALREALAEQPAQQEPVACSVCEQVHLILDNDPSQIIRDAKDGYPDGRAPRVLTLPERVTALCMYAAHWKRWCLEHENTSPPAQRKPLTDEDLIECERLAGIRHRIHMGSIRGQQLSPADQFLWHYARAIEAAHGIGEKK